MIEIRNLSKTFSTADGRVDALRDVNLTINDGDIYGIIGMSGAGKSTLVRCVNFLERPSSGTVTVNGVDLSRLGEKELRAARRKISMIFQSFNLLMQKNCLDNIMLPLRLAGVKKTEAEQKALSLLTTVGLPDKAKAYPAQLSGGQQQRIAIARALTTDPDVLLCDEATSALDPKTTRAILELIRDINRKTGITVIVITHQMSVVQEICNRVAILENGSVVEEGEVGAVFSAPKAEATRNLVFPEMAASLEPLRGQYLRLVYSGAPAAQEPLLAKMAIDTGIAASVQSASLRTAGSQVYGYMLLRIPGGAEALKAATEYLSGNPNVKVTVEDQGEDDAQ